MAVVRHVGAEPPVGLVGTLVDQDVLRLVPTEAVVVELLEPVEPGERLVGGGRLGVATVEEPGAVVGPGGAREFDPPEMIVQVARGGDVAHVKLFPVRAARGGPVGGEAAVSSFCCSIHRLVSALSGSSSQRYGSWTLVPW